MDIQRKKGMLEVCVLAALKKGPSYGYRIAREVEQCVDISESTLYPILKRLEQNGCLQTCRQEYNGRMRKYYRLTGVGQDKIDGFLDEWEELQDMYRFVAEQNREAACTANGRIAADGDERIAGSSINVSAADEAESNAAESVQPVAGDGEAEPNAAESVQSVASEAEPNAAESVRLVVGEAELNAAESVQSVASEAEPNAAESVQAVAGDGEAEINAAEPLQPGADEMEFNQEQKNEKPADTVDEEKGEQCYDEG